MPQRKSALKAHVISLSEVRKTRTEPEEVCPIAVMEKMLYAYFNVMTGELANLKARTKSISTTKGARS